ncbi:thiosulfate dehydrogenase, partial [Flavobacterium sinopsychrotolerans]
ISKKPVDHPFGPFSDRFTEIQHKFGPFKPIKEAKKKNEKK